MADKNFVAYGDAETILSEFAVDIKNKVDKISGKGLSSNDFTTAEKNKLAGIENAANKTTVDTAFSSTSENPLQNKVINSALLNKVDKVSGKGLSTNDYTTNEKNKLAGIDVGANKTTVDTALSSTSENPLQNKAINSALSNKVDKVSGKGLSTNDYTTDEKNKLAGIEVGADKTTVDTALSSTSENPLQNKAINSALSNKVDKVSGKGLSTNDYTTNEKNKLAGIASGAQVNSVTGVKGNSESSYRTGNINITKANIGLGNVDNTADANKTVNKANTLTTARYIDGISFDGSGNISHFGICSTAAGTAGKAVSVTGTPVLDAGTRIIVRFQYANTASSPTLNVNSLGAKPIKLSNYGSSGSSAGSTTWGAGYVMEFVYANSYWIAVRGENATTSYDGLMSAADKTKLNGIATGAQVNSVTGVKGSNESSYRTGNINITKANIGLGNVDNTADADKSVSYAESASNDADGDSITGNYLKWLNSDGTARSVTAFQQFLNNYNDSKMGATTITENSNNKVNQYLYIPSNAGSYGFYIRNPWGDTNLYVGKKSDHVWKTERALFDTHNCAVELDTTGTSNNGGRLYNNVIKFPSGLCIQWGRHTNMPNGTAVYFKYAYSYQPSVTFANGQGYAASISAMTWFNDGALSSNVDWMAIGYIS